MMKKIKEKYDKSQLDYINLDRLKFKIIRRKDDNFYKIVDNTKIRRNYSFTSEEIIKQSTLFDLGEMYLLSKIHIKESNLMKLKIEISPNIQGPWVAVENDLIIVSGKIRVLNIGSLPCRFFRLTVVKGCPIMDFTKVECYGLNINDIKSKYDEDTLDMLYYNSYDLIYRKANLSSPYVSNYSSNNESKFASNIEKSNSNTSAAKLKHYTNTGNYNTNNKYNSSYKSNNTNNKMEYNELSATNNTKREQEGLSNRNNSEIENYAEEYDIDRDPGSREEFSAGAAYKRNDNSPNNPFAKRFEYYNN